MVGCMTHYKTFYLGWYFDFLRSLYLFLLCMFKLRKFGQIAVRQFMKKIALSVIVSLFCLSSVNVGANDTQEEQALDSLIAKIESIGFYKKRLNIECLRFEKTSETKKYFEFKAYELDNSDNCSGDPGIAPTVDRFRFIKRTKKIMLYQIAADKFLLLGHASAPQR